MSNFRGKIIKELEKRGAIKPCSRCSHNKFTLLGDLARVDQQKDFKSVRLGGNAIPCAMVACSNCGNVSFHAIGILGLMDELTKPEEEKGDSND